MRDHHSRALHPPSQTAILNRFGDVRCFDVFGTRVDALSNQRGGLAGVFTRQVLVTQGRHFDLDVDAVEQRSGDARAVTLDLQRRADAFLLRIAQKAARIPLRCLFVM